MLRPSRPMIRPFISSPGSSISRVVVSLACAPAIRLIAIARMLRALRSASRLVSSSICIRARPGAVARVVLDVGDQQLLGLVRRQPGEPLELLALHGLLPLQLLGLLVEVALAVVEGPLAALDLAAPQPLLLAARAGRAPRAGRSPRAEPGAPRRRRDRGLRGRGRRRHGVAGRRSAAVRVGLGRLLGLSIPLRWTPACSDRNIRLLLRSINHSPSPAPPGSVSLRPPRCPS